MPKITAIKPQKKIGRFNIFIDGKYSFGVDSLTLTRNHLSVGIEMPPDLLTGLQDQTHLQRLLDKTINFLSFRPRSESEIVSYLIKNKASKSEQQHILEKVKELNLVDDKEFAKWWVNQRQTFRPKGLRLVKSELTSKGVSREVIDTLESNSQTEEKNATQLLRKNWPKWQRFPPDIAKRRAAGFLIRRGFDWDIVKKAIDHVAGGSIE